MFLQRAQPRTRLGIQMNMAQPTRLLGAEELEHGINGSGHGRTIGCRTGLGYAKFRLKNTFTYFMPLASSKPCSIIDSAALAKAGFT